MSCRMNPAGSLATTFIARAHDIEDGQDTHLFHAALRRSRARVEEQGPYDPSALRAMYDLVVSAMEAEILHSGRWDNQGLRERALRRVARARTLDVGAQPHQAAALCAVLDMARNARQQMNRLFEGVAREHEGLTRAQVASEFRRLYRLNPPEGPGDDILRGYDPLFAPAGGPAAAVPADERTRKAMRILLHGQRCSSCGQFTSPSAAPAHACPAGPRAAATGPRPARPAETPSPGPAAPAPAAPPAPWEASEFQDVYDKAKARIAETGSARVPTNPALEATPGGVTGGLGARDGGLTFGLELEVDFPEEEYPYESRYRLAQRLFQEGLTASPHVERWHFVSGEDRPGGDYVHSPGDWVCEFDRSVDDMEGERGLEIKSQILYDEPQTWANLRRICEIAEEMGARPTMRTGLHVNVGGGEFPSDDTSRHNALLRLAGAYDDTIIRLAHNPEAGPRHRGRSYCRYVHAPVEGFRDVATARSHSGHYEAFNLRHLPASGERPQRSSRVEHRVWDSTLDPGRIQAAVTVSLALVRSALDGVPPGQDAEPAGTHRARYGGGRLSGEEWDASTESFRRLVALVGAAGANTEHHREALTTMYAATRWQQQ